MQATAGPKNVKKIDAGKIQYAPNERGQAPWGVDGKRIEIHHVDQEPYGDAEEMTATEHRGPGNYKKNHPNGNAPSKIDRPEFDQWKKEYWQKEWDSGRFDGMPSHPDVVEAQSGH